MLKIIKPLSVVLVFTTAAGLLLHDMKIDKATSIALMPGLVASAGALSMAMAKMDHIHVERGSAPKQALIFNSSLPKVHPPKDDDRRYIQNKKHLSLSGGGSQASLWPSV